MTDNQVKQQDTSAASTPAPDEKPALKPGALLAEYREKAGLTVEQVASRLKMANRQVQQIEADNYESMASVAIARGFVRAYARLLNVDPEPLVAMFPAENLQAHLPTQDKRIAQEKVSKSRTTFGSRRGGHGKLIAWAAGIGLIIVALFVWRSGLLPINLQSKKKPVEDQEQAARQNLKVEDSARRKSASGVVSTDLPMPRTVGSEAAQPAEAGKHESQAEQAPSAPVSAPAATPAASEAPAANGAADAASSAAAQAGKGILVLRAREKSWVQVLRANGSVLFERILMPGQTEMISTSEPVAVTIGYARGVDATFRGQPLELRTADGSTVARLNLK